jgi:hypothetical protein
MHNDRCGNTLQQKCCAKGSGKETKIQEFMFGFFKTNGHVSTKGV